MAGFGKGEQIAELLRAGQDHRGRIIMGGSSVQSIELYEIIHWHILLHRTM
jgi:hypothetical protein